MRGAREAERLRQRLEEIRSQNYGDPESAHLEADRALLEFIDDREVEKAYDRIEKWYA